MKKIIPIFLFIGIALMIVPALLETTFNLSTQIIVWCIIIGAVIVLPCAVIISNKSAEKEFEIKESSKKLEDWTKPTKTWEDFDEENPKHEISIEEKETKKYDIKPEPKRTPIKKDEPCYVYLMKNERNGYHKIGISNNPEYREKTLQAEEPEIKKLVAKRYPNREIARQIESMLHKNFGNKHLRGEWFNLDLEEITMVKTLLV